MVKERAFDLAILRTYGASNFQLIKMICYEGFLIAFLAFLLGSLLIKIGLGVFVSFIESRYQQNIIRDLSFLDIMQIGLLIFIMVFLSRTLAIFPILKMNISTILSNEK